MFFSDRPRRNGWLEACRLLLVRWYVEVKLGAREAYKVWGAGDNNEALSCLPQYAGVFWEHLVSSDQLWQ